MDGECERGGAELWLTHFTNWPRPAAAAAAAAAPVESAVAAALILMGLHPGAAQTSQLPSGGIAVTTHVGATFLYNKPVCEFGYVTMTGRHP